MKSYLIVTRGKGINHVSVSLNEERNSIKSRDRDSMISMKNIHNHKKENVVIAL